MSQDQAAQERLASLERKISRLEDIEAIRSLLVTYANFNDTDDWDRFGSIFADDAHLVITAPFNVDVRSPEAVVTANRGFGDVFRKRRHNIFNVGIDPEQGSGGANFMATFIEIQKNQSMICEGNYRFKFVRENGHWRIGEQIIDIVYLSPASWKLENV